MKPLGLKIIVRQEIEDYDLALKIKLSNQGVLAKSIGCSRAYLSGCIYGKYKMSQKIYIKVKNYFSEPNKI
jgi:hypothetical protein